MIGCYRIVQDGQPVPFPGLIKPVKPTAAVPCKFEQEFPFMTTMRDVPNITGDKMPLCSSHYT